MHQRCVLIIEGNSAQALANLLLLEETGLRVLWARNGWEGLEMAKRFTPDAIVLDVELPEIDGFEICRLLKDDPLTRQIPVIMHTLRDFGPDLVLSLELGAVDFIPKDSFSGPALLAALKGLKVLDLPVQPGVEQ